MLTINNLQKKLGGRMILKSVSARLDAQVVGLLGANGAGKTTLIRCLTGIYDLDGGSIAYEGKDINKSSDYRPHLGYLPQAFGMFRELTVWEMMDYFCALKKVPKAQREAMIRACLQKVNLEDRIKSRVSSLSGGMTRRVGIAQALLGNPKVIILDEPTSGLDPQERVRFKSMVTRMRGQGLLVLLSTHIVDDVEEVCDQVMVMHEGEILFMGDCEALIEKARDKVYLVPTAMLLKMAGDDFYETQAIKNGSRVIFKEHQTRFEPLEPTLEDGYMAVMKGLA
jgi:ABC-2 type transport system ATP-binding protein